MIGCEIKVAHIVHVEFNFMSGMFIADNGEGFCLQVNQSMTDIGKDEPVEDFVVRHGGLTETTSYLLNLI